MHSADKPLNQMNRLADMAHFPAAVNAGATLNILLTLAVTWLLQPWLLFRLGANLPVASVGFLHGAPILSSLLAAALPGLVPPPDPAAVHHARVAAFAAPLLWTALVLAINLTPDLLLRRTLRSDTPYPSLRTMNFFTDQHKFSDWVYLAASANMAFWILVGWLAFLWQHTPGTLLAMLLAAALVTFSPVLLRSRP